MLITTAGVVIRERHIGENDKFVDILTEKNGVIEVSVKGVKKLNSTNAAATQLYTYSNFCIKKQNDRYYLNSSEQIKNFYGIRMDIDKLSLACYFSEVITYAVPSEESNGEILRLLLNTLYYLSNSSRDNAMLKSVFELRFVCEIGMMPNVIACTECGNFESEKMFFDLNGGCFYCENCFSEAESDNIVSLTPAVISAVRHIVLADFNRLFNFKISPLSQNKLSHITEQYLLTHVGKSFRTLDFYKSITQE